MSLVPTVYRSTDPGAPVLNGQPGSLAALLDAVLVDGYGSGPTAKAPLGWLRVFTGLNKRVFRNDPAKSFGGFFRFDDNDPRYVSVTGYGTMTDVDTGTEPYSATPYAWPKSSTSDTVARAWLVIGNERTVYLFATYSTTISPAVGGKLGTFFGDLRPLGAMDTWCCGFSRSAGATYTSGSFDVHLFTSASGRGPVVARSANGSTIGMNLANRGALFSGQGAWGLGTSLPYPYPTTNGAVLSRPILNEGTNMRATLPGTWISEHVLAFASGAAYSGFVDLPPGTELWCQEAWGSAGAGANLLFDITNAWEY